MRNKKGFTLLELLVVVLIIGILASIALPQYTKAVEKAKLSEALTTLKSIEDSLYRLMYENDNLENPSFDILDIELPNQSENDYATENFEYILFGDEISQRTFTELSALRTNHSYELVMILNVDGNGKTRTLRYCYTLGTDVGDYICNILRAQGWAYCDDPLGASCSPE